jgi:hypothetical protein
MNDETRFWAKVKRGADDECWLWLGARSGKYGRFNPSSHTVYVHRWSYEKFVGPIPDGLTIDHLCGTPLCVNPSHLEAVTLAENIRRGLNATKTHCTNGHLFDEENTYIRKEGWRGCRVCRAEAVVRRTKRLRMETQT